MINKATKIRWDKLKPLPKDLEDEIRLNGILTGSRAWGVHQDDSDEDILFLEDEEIRFGILVSSGYAFYDKVTYNRMDFRSIYLKFKDRDHIINLLLFKDEKTFKKYIMATKKIKRWAESYSFHRFIIDKEIRCYIFEKLVGVKKTALDEPLPIPDNTVDDDLPF